MSEQFWIVSFCKYMSFWSGKFGLEKPKRNVLSCSLPESGNWHFCSTKAISHTQHGQVKWNLLRGYSTRRGPRVLVRWPRSQKSQYRRQWGICLFFPFFVESCMIWETVLKSEMAQVKKEVRDKTRHWIYSLGSTEVPCNKRFTESINGRDENYHQGVYKLIFWFHEFCIVQITCRMRVGRFLSAIQFQWIRIMMLSSQEFLHQNMRCVILRKECVLHQIYTLLSILSFSLFLSFCLSAPKHWIFWTNIKQFNFLWSRVSLKTLRETKYPVFPAGERVIFSLLTNTGPCSCGKYDQSSDTLLRKRKRIRK